MLTVDDLRTIANSVESIRGWDFSRVREVTDPAPWDYVEVVRRYLQPSSRVLDIGTGGGEIFLRLAPCFASGVGADAEPSMIEVARQNTPSSLAHAIDWMVMPAQALDFPPESFDIVLDRHAPVWPEIVVDLLRPGGHFITQQVGGRNTENIFQMFGWESSGAYWQHYWQTHGLRPQDIDTLGEVFSRAGCTVVARGEYNVRYTFLDVESLIFHLKAVPLPEDFEVERHGERLLRFIEENRTSEGVETNEHRTLLVMRKDPIAASIAGSEVT